MSGNKKHAVIREEDKELLGFVAEEGSSWQAQTMFGYPIDRMTSREEAERIVRERGLSYLTGLWQYFDTDDQAWYPCILKEAHEQQVTVIRTSPMGYQDPDDYKVVRIKDPSETNLVKS
ncbi:MAG TPA: hypothetical protein VFZ62_04010 [Candidatus Saccharimonadales bacterium]